MLETLLTPAPPGPLNVPCDDPACPAVHHFDQLVDGIRCHDLTDQHGWPHRMDSTTVVLCPRCRTPRLLNAECVGCRERIRRASEGLDVYRLATEGLFLWRHRTKGAGPVAWCRLHQLEPTTTATPILIHGAEVVFREYLLRDGKKYLDREYGGVATRPRRIALLASPPPYALELMT